MWYANSVSYRLWYSNISKKAYNIIIHNVYTTPLCYDGHIDITFNVPAA